MGGGFFESFARLPVSLAWDAFGQANGVGSRAEFLSRIGRYRRTPVEQGSDPTVGCIILSDPFFFTREEWIPVPASWPMNIVQGKSFDVATVDGGNIWRQVRARLSGSLRSDEAASVAESPGTYLVRARLGQGAFRVMVTEAYGGQCAISGERTLPALEAAHIVPYALQGPNEVSNGILLRADMHKLFDEGLLSVSRELRVQVSPKIRDRFQNGREYYAFHDQQIRVLPARADDRPDPTRLAWHFENVFIR